MKIKGVLYVDQTPHQATLKLEKVADNVLIDNESVNVKQNNNNDLKTRSRVTLSIDKDIMENLRKLSKLNNIPMCRMVDKAILAMYGDEFHKIH